MLSLVYLQRELRQPSCERLLRIEDGRSAALHSTFFWNATVLAQSSSHSYCCAVARLAIMFAGGLFNVRVIAGMARASKLAESEHDKPSNIRSPVHIVQVNYQN